MQLRRSQGHGVHTIYKTAISLNRGTPIQTPNGDPQEGTPNFGKPPDGLKDPRFGTYAEGAVPNHTEFLVGFFSKRSPVLVGYIKQVGP